MTEISSENRTKKDIINDFLEEVERKLPFWLKDEKEEVKEILEELENHIWDKATEFADGEEPSEQHIDLAIEQMGKPSKIAEEYKQRGKPKLFITEELFPMYQKTLVVVGAFLFALNFIIMLFKIGSGDALRSFFSGLFLTLLIDLVIITVIFVALSKEGYLPNDFQRITARFPVNIQTWFSSKKKETSRVESAAYDGPEPITEKTTAYPASKAEATETYDESYESAEATRVEEPKVSILKETKFVEKPQVVKETIIVERPRARVSIERDRTPRTKRTVKTTHTKGRNYLSDGISGIIFGSVIVIFAFLPLLDFLEGAKYAPLKWWMVGFGGIILAIGLIRFMQAMIGRVLRLQQGMMFLSTIPTAARIPLYLILLKPIAGIQPMTTQAINIMEQIVIKLSDLFNAGWVFDAGIALTVLKVLVYVSIAVTALSIISELSRIARLEAEGFPIREKVVTEYR